MSNMQDTSIKVGVLGASGYTGADLVRLLLGHPDVEISLLTAERKAGQSMAQIFPHFAAYPDLPMLQKIDTIDWQSLALDVVFCALPHATTQGVIAKIFKINKSIKVIDLSADFRLRDVDTYTQWYGNEHQAKELQHQAVYGLTEYYRSDIKTANLVACPGCYPTATLLPLKILFDQKLITADHLIIDAKSGVSGAGRSLKEAFLYTEVAEAMAPYGVGHHRHMPEIEQELTASNDDTSVKVSFTPHLVPMNRGMLVTSYVQTAEGVSLDDLRSALHTKAASESFMTLLDEGVMPASRMVRGSNHAVINLFKDRLPGRAIVISAIDNLVKGSSGQAIQNMNLLFGFAEETGLQQVALFP